MDAKGWPRKLIHVHGCKRLGWHRFKLVSIHLGSLVWRGCMCIDIVAFQSSKTAECQLWHIELTLHGWPGS